MTSSNTADGADAHIEQHCARHDIAVVSLGNTLRADDAVASAVVAALPKKDNLCVLEAGLYTRDIPTFLSGHRVGIIVDAMRSNSNQPTEVIHLDSSNLRVNLTCCHALSWLDELSLFGPKAKLQKRLIFFGIAVSDTEWRQGLSQQMQQSVPQLVDKLSDLITAEAGSRA